ncbi:hypothetical protein CHS0354_008267 [Potamilus streckersoni]|uniref:Peptidase M12B domain-containing protein n=1 Tax=Potamilus streckersoni TaxID=2493646 RepID=A0AAE0RU26_9BIVA|nr:hypothetical protein CHS0354_008267 [Potamilus streckersoni]
MAIVQARDLFWAIFTAVHELGHVLGAEHDGYLNSCKAKDHFVMSEDQPEMHIMRSSRNPWLFSSCSVNAFKNTLKKRKCVTKPGSFYDIEEYMTYVQTYTGQRYSPDDQCRLHNGLNSKLCETDPPHICHSMRCTNPTTGECLPEYNGAARGTLCGHAKYKSRLSPLSSTLNALSISSSTSQGYHHYHQHQIPYPCPLLQVKAITIIINIKFLIHVLFYKSRLTPFVSTSNSLSMSSTTSQGYHHYHQHQMPYPCPLLQVKTNANIINIKCLIHVLFYKSRLSPLSSTSNALSMSSTTSQGYHHYHQHRMPYPCPLLQVKAITIIINIKCHIHVLYYKSRLTPLSSTSNALSMSSSTSRD